MKPPPPLAPALKSYAANRRRNLIVATLIFFIGIFISCLIDLVYFSESPFQFSHLSSLHSNVFFTGLSLSLVIALFFLFISNRKIVIEQEVLARTNQLTNINRILQKEMQTREKIEKDLIIKQNYLQKRHETLNYLAKLTTAELQSAIQEVVSRTADVMQVNRVGVWLYECTATPPQLSCYSLYILSNDSFLNDFEVRPIHFSHYLEALSKEPHLILPSSEDERINQELTPYFNAFQIQSKLDIPIIFKGKLLGVLSCEETRAFRQWLLEDCHFGHTIADIVAIMMEQAARRQGEKALQESEKRLMKAMQEANSANAAKSAFIATISHELRTPLNAIIGFTHCILEEMDGPINEAQKESLKKIEKSSLYLFNLINDILDWSKIEAKKMDLELSLENIVKLVYACVEEMSPLAEQKNLSIDIVSENPVILVEIDPIRIQQVFLNLLSNAIKFTDKGSIKIKITLSEKQDSIQQLELLNSIRIEITDTGIGLLPEEIDKIFHPFTQADHSITRKYGGSGLGLAISKNIIKLHHGKITVKSEKGKGSTFTIILPR